jgi:uncharacterized membrane protein YkvI
MTRMRANATLFLLLALVAVTSAGCELVEGIFKAGVWVGVILVVVVLLAIMWIVGKLRR